jgi:hypothetical protein
MSRLLLSVAVVLAGLALLPPGAAAPPGVHAATPVSCSATSVQDALTAGGDYAFGADCTLLLTSTLTMDGGTVSLDGAGHAVIFDGQNQTQILEVTAGDLTLNSLTLQHANGGTTTSGAIESLGSLTVTNSSFVDNVNSQSFGGAIRANGSLLVANSTFLGNAAQAGGGAIAAASTVVVTGSTFVSNTTPTGGGALLLNPQEGQGSVANSTFTGNSATNNPGGAIVVLHGTVAVVNSTLSGNTDPSGGALATVNELSPVTISVSNTLIANNTCATQTNGVIDDGGNNLEFQSSGPNTTCGFTTNVQHGDPQLGTLTNNGGPTQTMAIGTTGAAYNTGNPAVCAAAPVNGVDQRDEPRTASCSIGAYEPAPPAPTATATETAAATATATALPYPTYACAGLAPTRKLGDINGDGVINLSDFTIFAEDYGKDTSQGAVLTSPYSDMTCDGKVDLTDFSIFAGQYGQ